MERAEGESRPSATANESEAAGHEENLDASDLARERLADGMSAPRRERAWQMSGTMKAEKVRPRWRPLKLDETGGRTGAVRM